MIDSRNDALLNIIEDNPENLIDYITQNSQIDVNNKFINGTTLLTKIASLKTILNNHANVFNFLISVNANVDDFDNLGYTPLIYASQNGHIQLVDILIHYHANINHQANDGSTALINAAAFNQFEVAQKLLDYKADIFLVDNEMKNALKHAEDRIHTKLINLLYKHYQ